MSFGYLSFRHLPEAVQPALMDDRIQFATEPGDVSSLASGHDPWVVGDEQVLAVDWFGTSDYIQ
jgi:hypothetical protein